MNETAISSYQQILFEKDSRVATITLNRPAKLNAYSETMVHEILAALADARDDDEIRAVIRRAIAVTSSNPCSKCAKTCTC
jgi:enoyl-CoA hydratase/carnithine racemase